MQYFILMTMMLFLSACSTSTHYAPVVDVAMIESIPNEGVHTVKAGETLYQIAWRYGMDYRYLAKRNQINSPYAIFTGQKLYLRGAISESSLRHSSSPRVAEEVVLTSSKWLWPAKGSLLRVYSPINKGIDISGRVGEPIYAAAAGQVVYSGDGLRGYGNLIIIKHSHLYLSAYAHNRIIFVREGEFVKIGQKIAEMGNAGHGSGVLHFEVRRAGKPINPMELY